MGLVVRQLEGKKYAISGTLQLPCRGPEEYLALEASLLSEVLLADFCVVHGGGVDVELGAKPVGVHPGLERFQLILQLCLPSGEAPGPSCCPS